MDKTTTMHDLKASVREDVQEQIDELIEAGDAASERIHEIAFAAVPIYNADLLDAIKSDLWLGCSSKAFDDCVAPSGDDMNVFRVIQIVIFRELRVEAEEELDRLKDEEGAK